MQSNSTVVILRVTLSSFNVSIIKRLAISCTDKDYVPIQ